MMSPVEDQGNLGSCTGNAIAGAIEFLENKNLPRSQFIDISRLFIYYNERAIEGTIAEDSGAYIRDGVKAVATIGACSEKTWPYVIRKFKTKPPTRAFTAAAKRKITEYLRIADLAGIKQSLAAGFPVVFGFEVYAQFESDQCAADGIVKLPSPNEQSIGGHAVLAVGYDDVRKALLVRNSWGAEWGMQGYFWLPYGYINNGLADDFWSIRK
jgi:C1A family cysteine protease